MILVKSPLYQRQQFSLLVFLKYESRSLRPKGRGFLERGVFFWFFSKKTKKKHTPLLLFSSPHISIFLIARIAVSKRSKEVISKYNGNVFPKGAL